MMHETEEKALVATPRDTGNLSMSRMSLTMLSLWIYAP
jgi:hypothetical protein